MDWHRLSDGPYPGKTIPEVMFHELDPDYVLDGLQNGEFSGAVQDEAAELCRRAAHIRLDPDLVVYYHVDGGCYAGLDIVPRGSPQREECEKTAAAHTDGFLDLTVLRRLAPEDKRATVRLMQAFEYHCLGERTSLVRFFENPENFPRAPAAHRAA